MCISLKVHHCPSFDTKWGQILDYDLNMLIGHIIVQFMIKHFLSGLGLTWT